MLLLRSMAAIVLPALISFSTSVQAQDTEDLKTDKAEVFAQKSTEQMTKRLSLTPEQVPMVQRINLKFAEAAAPIIKGGGDRKSKAQALKPLAQERKSALQGILTPEQFEQFEALQQENRQKAKERYRSRR